VIAVSAPSIAEREHELVADAIKSGWVSSAGPYVDRFEQAFAKFCGTRYALSVNNGTSALHLALMALDIGPGHEVIVPDLTFVATANAVAYTGAEVVLADVEPDTLGLSARTIAPHITPRTKAVIPVHLYGHPVSMGPILTLAAQHGLKVIEDAAQAHGARYWASRAGSMGDCGVFSFYGNKIITTGEGGMITTNDERIYQRAFQLRGHAMHPQRRYWHEEIGYNYRMTNLQAALGCAQLESIHQFLQFRRVVFDMYRTGLKRRPGLRLNTVKVWAESSLWMVCLEYDGFDQGGRDEFMAALALKGIETRPYFHTLSSMPMYEREPLPVAERKSRIGLCLPTHCNLSLREVSFVIDTVNSLLDDLEQSVPERPAAQAAAQE